MRRAIIRAQARDKVKRIVVLLCDIPVYIPRDLSPGRG